MEDWAEIRRLHRAEGMPIKAIARQAGGLAEHGAAGAGGGACRRGIGGRRGVRSVDAVEPAIRELLAEWPTMPATVIAERIGWDRSLTVLKDRVRELRPLFVPPDPASRTDVSARVSWPSATLWFPPVDVPLGAGQVGRPPVLVMVCGLLAVDDRAMMLPSRQAPDLLAGHWQLLAGWGRCRGRWSGTTSPRSGPGGPGARS